MKDTSNDADGDDFNPFEDPEPDCPSRGPQRGQRPSSNEMPTSRFQPGQAGNVGGTSAAQNYGKEAHNNNNKK